ncbi:MAG: hypothetical protein V4582_02240 [Pseudomonadota bacterium]
MTAPATLDAWRANPFFVLELGCEATRADVERAGQRLLALLAIETEGVRRYTTPLGPARRDADDVRRALAALRDPQQRMLHELWANIAPLAHPKNAARNDPAASGWAEAGRAFGWADV